MAEAVDPLVGPLLTVSTEGAALAAGGLILMAAGAVFFGALRSVGRSERSKNSSSHDGDDDDETSPEIIRSRDAARVPLVASGVLLGLYALFKVFPRELVELAMGAFSVFYCGLGVLALSRTMRPLVAKVLPTTSVRRYELLLTRTRKRTTTATTGGGGGEGGGEQADNNNKEELVSCGLDVQDVACLAPCAAVGLWYLLTRHWVANDLLGLALALNGVEMLHLNDVATGVVLLGGLFLYDVFWVFATDVMVTVAKSVDGPVLLVFPLDLPERGFSFLEAGRDQRAMLGLGDIIIPGMFVALLLRFDVSLQGKNDDGNGRRTYFCAGFSAYVLGVVLAEVAVYTFKCAQPALLYLAPACVGLPLAVAHFRGELAAMFAYDETSPQPEEEKKGSGGFWVWATGLALPQETEEPGDESSTEKR